MLGDYPGTAALKSGALKSDLVDFRFADIKVANTGFKPLVREHKFDLSELAIVTFLQAKAYGKPYALLPAVVVARPQHHTLAYNPERGALTPGGLVGKRVGVRAYTVTTGVWVRGILREQYAVDLERVAWVSFEDPHLAEYTDPRIVYSARCGSSKLTHATLSRSEEHTSELQSPDHLVCPLLPVTKKRDNPCQRLAK